MNMEIYTVGHSNRSLEEFIDLLNAFQVKILVDVRSFPSSKKVPQFNRANLEKALSLHDIIYLWMGDTLGGLRKGGYQAHTLTAEFRAGIEKLKSLLHDRAAIMCAEKFPWRCHRIYISRELQNQGIKCIHILDTQKTWIPKDLTNFF